MLLARFNFLLRHEGRVFSARKEIAPSFQYADFMMKKNHSNSPSDSSKAAAHDQQPGQLASEPKSEGLTDKLNSSSNVASQMRFSGGLQQSTRMTVQRAKAEKIRNNTQAESLGKTVKQLAAESPPKSNNSGLPDNLKSGIESLSGVSMDHVKVNYNSDKPAQLNAHAFAQGSEIHLASGQEQHLPHEAWHVVQQAQGRVKPTTQMKGDVPVNDDKHLEHEADVMGAKALQMKSASGEQLQPLVDGESTFQFYQPAKDAMANRVQTAKANAEADQEQYKNPADQGGNEAAEANGGAEGEVYDDPEGKVGGAAPASKKKKGKISKVKVAKDAKKAIETSYGAWDIVENSSANYALAKEAGENAESSLVVSGESSTNALSGIWQSFTATVKKILTVFGAAAGGLIDIGKIVKSISDIKDKRNKYNVFAAVSNDPLNDLQGTGIYAQAKSWRAWSMAIYNGVSALVSLAGNIATIVGSFVAGIGAAVGAVLKIGAKSMNSLKNAGRGLKAVWKTIKGSRGRARAGHTDIILSKALSGNKYAAQLIIDLNLGIVVGSVGHTLKRGLGKAVDMEIEGERLKDEQGKPLNASTTPEELISILEILEKNKSSPDKRTAKKAQMTYKSLESEIKTSMRSVV